MRKVAQAGKKIVPTPLCNSIDIVHNLRFDTNNLIKYYKMFDGISSILISVLSATAFCEDETSRAGYLGALVG